MSFTGTTNFSWQIPNQGTETGVWGTDTLTYMQACDATVKTVQTTAQGALPVAGGTMTGLANQFTETATLSVLGNVSGNVALNLANGQAFSMTATAQITGFTFSNVPATANSVQPLILLITNGGTGGQPVWNGSFAGFKFPGGTAPTLSTAGTDIMAFLSFDQGTTYRNSGSAIALS